jgi:hypothetical protein
MGTSKKKLAVGTKVHIFITNDAQADGVIVQSEDEDDGGGFYYRVTADGLDDHRGKNGALWINDFEASVLIVK